ncbi:RNA polymerase sigma factor [Nannocystaceae bacterium ST9]
MNDPLSLPAFVVGNVAFVVMAAATLLGLIGLPLLRGLGVAIAGVRWLVLQRASSARSLGRGLGLERPLELAGLSAPLADLARQTRLLALELRRWDAQAERWPDDRRVEPSHLRWLDSFLGAEAFAPQTAASREVFEWLRSVDALPAGDRARLATLGIDPERVREALLDERSPDARMRTLAGLIGSIDERLLDAGATDYRGSVGLRVAAPRLADDDDDDADQLRARRRRWAAVLAEHGPGLSRMAGRHARTAAEREDLEQDIALALWQSLDRWRGEASIQTFAYKVARYCCCALLRRRARVELDLDVDAEAFEDPDASIDAWLARLDDLARLERAREELPEGLGSTLALRLEGKSYAEIAEALGISERNVSVRLVRARQQLERRLVAA